MSTCHHIDEGEARDTQGPSPSLPPIVTQQPCLCLVLSVIVPPRWWHVLLPGLQTPGAQCTQTPAVTHISGTVLSAGCTAALSCPPWGLPITNTFTTIVSAASLTPVQLDLQQSPVQRWDLSEAAACCGASVTGWRAL